MNARPTSTRDLALIAVFAAFLAVSALVPTFTISGNIPFSLQPLAVLLCGAVLGARRGFLAVLLYLVVGAIGLPIFSQGAAGIGVFAGGTGGYLVGFLLGALVTGLVVEQAARAGVARLLAVALIGALLGVAVITVVGIAGMVVNTPASPSTATTIAMSYVPFDLIKAAMAASVATAVHAAFPDLLRTPQRTRVAERETIDA